MCQSLVDKVARSRQLRSVTDPDLLVLFEDWLEELEEEVAAYLRQNPESGAAALSENLGLSLSGATFLIAKLRREQEI
ncbi:MAG: hypothetical protein ACD_74C00269G0003 [uncultured bacterium]|nr:MAG: hypothetical protein ACD_74C00269G0003 [uncultured bacterium]